MNAFQGYPRSESARKSEKFVISGGGSKIRFSGATKPQIDLEPLAIVLRLKFRKQQFSLLRYFKHFIFMYTPLSNRNRQNMM